MIPKIIHYCWVGGKPLPASAKKCIDSWRNFCPDYEIREWNEKNYDFTKIPYMREALEEKKWGFATDYARLDIVYTYGGIYLDADVEIIKSFDPLLENHGFIGFETDEYCNTGQGFGAEAGNEVIKAIIDSYSALHFRNEDGSLNLQSCPEFNTPVLCQLGLKKNSKRQTLSGCFEIYPGDFFCPKSVYDGVIRCTSNTYSIHHYDASWFEEEQQREKQDRWKNKQTLLKRKRLRSRIKGILQALIGEKIYNWLQGIR